jgi:hypothetical protein
MPKIIRKKGKKYLKVNGKLRRILRIRTKQLSKNKYAHIYILSGKGKRGGKTIAHIHKYKHKR